MFSIRKLHSHGSSIQGKQQGSKFANSTNSTNYSNCTNHQLALAESCVYNDSMKSTVTVSTLDELQVFARELVEKLKTQDTSSQATILTLEGDLGAGKTTLSQMIARELGVQEKVNSPTFVISKYYDLKKQEWQRLIHIDAYRLEGENLAPLGFEELFADPTNLIIIEWPQFIASILPNSHNALTIASKENQERIIDLNTKA